MFPDKIRLIRKAVDKRDKDTIGMNFDTPEPVKTHSEIPLLDPDRDPKELANKAHGKLVDLHSRAQAVHKYYSGISQNHPANLDRKIEHSGRVMGQLDDAKREITDAIGSKHGASTQHIVDAIGVHARNEGHVKYHEGITEKHRVANGGAASPPVGGK